MSYPLQYYRALKRGAAAPSIAAFQHSFSFRKVNPLYAGSCVRVRRSGDNAEQDIGFSGALLDQSALLAFVGSGDGFVKTWYNQVSSENFSQATLANQPRLVLGGVVDNYLGFPCMKFSTTDRLTIPSSSFLSIGTITSSQIHYVARLTKTGSSILFVFSGAAFGLVSQSGGGSTAVFQTWAKTAEPNPNDNYIAFVNGAQSSPYTNRGNVYTKHVGFKIISESNVGFSVSPTCHIGGYGIGFDYEDQVFEINSYFRNNDQYRNRTEIEDVQDSINAYYGAY
jgi:hypothetical protein